MAEESISGPQAVSETSSISDDGYRSIVHLIMLIAVDAVGYE